MKALDRWDALMLVGLGVVAGGAGLIYLPAGVILAGLALCGCAFLAAQAARPPKG